MDVSARKPPWLKIRPPSGESYLKIKSELRSKELHTVCEEARCPNLSECWASGTATFMLLGDTCTRRCHFCAVKTGNPLGKTDFDEPLKLARTLSTLSLKYAVLTTVDRDDLPDFGAHHLARCIQTIRTELETPPLIEMLTGDFRGQVENLKILCDAQPDVFAHNLETVERLTPQVRDRRATFLQSLRVLEIAKRWIPLTKSSLMLGMGETREEILSAMKALHDHGVSILTLGQYLQPSSKHFPVVEWIQPDTFESLRIEGINMGFDYVASGPLVRSSYKAAEQFILRRHKHVH